MKLKNKLVKRCLLCKNKKITEVFSLGNLFVSNFVDKKYVKKGIKAPLKTIILQKVFTYSTFSHRSSRNYVQKILLV